MKNFIKYFLQKLLGYSNYLYVFAVFKIQTLRSDSKENDFFRFLDLLPADATVADLGANIGIMTYHLSRWCSKGKIIAIEPIPDNFCILEKIIVRYSLKNVKALNIALGNKNEEIKMLVPKLGNAKQQGLSHVIETDAREKGDTFNVPCFTFDEIVKEEKITGIKIDVENYEYPVLTGALETLKKYKPIIYAELWDNENRQQCFKLLDSLGYKAYICDKNNLVLFDANIHKKQNFIFKLPL
jgi:FkbM family methyltransferase